MMKIRTSRLKNAALVEIEGRMDAASKESLQAICDRMLADGDQHIAVELSGLTYISSAGIGVLVRLASLLRDTGGVVSLCGAKGVVKTVLEITRVDSLFRMCASVDEVGSEEIP